MKRPIHPAALALWIVLLLSSCDPRTPATAPSAPDTEPFFTATDYGQTLGALAGPAGRHVHRKREPFRSGHRLRALRFARACRAPPATAPGCDPAPARDNYMNYYLMFTEGMMWFLGACGPGGAAGFLYAGPIGAGIGCAVVGLPTGFVAFSAEHERQNDAFKRAVRRWCNECKDEHWKNARFCANVLN